MCICVLITSILFLKNRETKLINYLGIMITFFLLINISTPDYKLMLLILPIILASKVHFQNILILLIWFPKHFYLISSINQNQEFTISTLINPILIFLLFAFYVFRFFKDYFNQYLNIKISKISTNHG
jgi:hypothetical protein